MIIPSIQDQQSAITSSGQTVTLNEDGTWDYVEQPTATPHKTFRNTCWGMTRKRVKQAETSELFHEEDHYLLYRGKIADLDCCIVYCLVEDRLVRARYVITEEHPNRNEYINDHETIKEALILKYGEPADDQVVWSADLYKEDDDDWGVSVSLGHLVFGCDWSTNSTDILLMLCGENYEISFVVEYSSQKLKPFEAAARKRKSLVDF